MPLYKYECSTCGEEFEARNTIEHRHFSLCEKCNGLGNLVPSVCNFTFGFIRSWDRHDGKGDRLVRNVSGL